MKRIFTLLLLICTGLIASAQEMILDNDYFRLDAEQNDPLYTTYTAAMARSRLFGDKGYKMTYNDNTKPVNYSSDKAGSSYNIFLVNSVAIRSTEEYYEKPKVRYSFADITVLDYSPYKDLYVEETFLVYSSKSSVVNMTITNRGDRNLKVVMYPTFELGNDSLQIEGYNSDNNSYITKRYETHKRLISNLYSKDPYPSNYREIFTMNVSPDTYGGYIGNVNDFYLKIKTDHYADDKYNDKLNCATEGFVDYISMQTKMELAPGESRNIRYIRGVQGVDEDINDLIEETKVLKKIDLLPFLKTNEDLYSNIPQIDFMSKEEKLVYIGAFNLARGCMLPPSGKTSHNYYVFSRHPLWGWGHGHQVLHESLTMIAYAYLDPQSAQESQRVYIEQQREDGLIAYRHGPRGLQDYPHFSKVLDRDMSTTSAPFFSWINLEIYEVSGDKLFLKEAYESGVKYTNWLLKNRDLDNDGTFEWGPYGIIENVRDWYNAVFQVSSERYLDIDKEDISDELECLDLSAMIVKEMRSLSSMAGYLGLKRDAKSWNKKASAISDLINERMWDNETGFYYSIDKSDHSFKFMTRDLRRPEIIGFLPLWANIASEERAEIIIKNYLLNPDKFWRKYGIPTLSADDEWFSPDVDYCCKWNGPVWLLWNYMVYDGLLNYGYKKEADELADKMLLAVTTQLSKNNNFWESYSPDNDVLNSPSNYIWDAIMAKILIDKYIEKEDR